MKIRYGSLENVIQAHHAGIQYGAIIGYVCDAEKGFGVRHWGFGKDLVSAQKTADILEIMAKDAQSKK